MRILIRNKGTGLFCVGEGEWTTEQVEARNFKTSLNAIQHARDRGLADAEMVYEFDGVRQNLVLPILNALAEEPTTADRLIAQASF